MKTVKLLSPTQLSQAKSYLDSTPLDGKWECVIREVNKGRSAAQNSLYWRWMGELEAQTKDNLGWTKDDFHTEYKRKFLVNIYSADTEHHPEFADMIESVREVYRGDKKLGQQLFNHILRETSTTAATVENFTEYLNYIEIDAGQHGWRLSRPEDLYRSAVGVE